MLTRKPLLSLFASLSLSACVIPFAVPLPNTGEVHTLDGQRQITELAQKPVNNTRARLHFYSVSPQFSADTDCNQVFGSFTTNQSKQLIFSDLASTRVACDNPIEQNLLQALPKVRQYRIYGNQLEMNDGNGTILLRGKSLQSNPTLPSLNPPKAGQAVAR